MRRDKLALLCVLGFCNVAFLSCEKDSKDDSSNSTGTVNTTPHDDPTDYSWDSATEAHIVLNGSTITSDSKSAIVNGNVVTITTAGNFNITGTSSDAQIVVNTSDETIVRLILNGVTISNTTTAPIYILKASKAMVVLADNTANTVSDASAYVYPSADVDEPAATIYSKANLTVFGNGSLTVNGNFNDGIASKDGLIIKSGTLTVNSVDDGIRGKDYLVVKEGNITLKSIGDGLISDNEDDAGCGYVTIESGVVRALSGGDAISAKSKVIIHGGEYNLTSGGGSNYTVATNASAKAIKAVDSLVIKGGTFTINAADDAIHSNKSIAISGGSFAIATGDDGVHADVSLTIGGGNIAISKSYEGIESAIITLNGGNVYITSSDDGVNVSGSNNGSGMGPGLPDNGQYLYVNGGYVVVNAVGDGVDVNGSVVMTAGTVIVNGPTNNGNGSLDYDGTFQMKGGFLIAAGSSGMAMVPSTTSTQNSLLINFTSARTAGTIFRLETSTGETVVTFSPTKVYQSIAFSSASLVKGSYNVYCGGTCSGAIVDGIYHDGGYTYPTSIYTTFTVSSAVTKIGNSGGGSCGF